MPPPEPKLTAGQGEADLVAVFGSDGGLQQVFGSPDSDPGNPCALSGEQDPQSAPSRNVHPGADRGPGQGHGRQADAGQAQLQDLRLTLATGWS
jgi:hypothetical protein